MSSTAAVVLVIVLGVLAVSAIAIKQSVGRLTSDVQAHLRESDQGSLRLFAVQAETPPEESEYQEADYPKSDVG